MCLLFIMLSRFVKLFFLEQVCFHFMTVVTICSDFGTQENKVCHCFHCFSSICHEVMGPDVMILVFWRFNFKPAFSLSSFTVLKSLFRSSLLSVPLVSLIFLKRSLVFPTVLFSSFSSQLFPLKAFLSLLASLWNCAFQWVYHSFFPLPFTSLLSYL